MSDPNLENRNPALSYVEGDSLSELRVPSSPETSRSQDGSLPSRRYRRVIDRVPSPAEELKLDQEVRDLLKQINFDSKLPKVPDEYALIQARPHQIFDALSFLKESQRRDLVRSFLEIGLRSKQTCGYVLSNLAPAITPLTPSERVEQLDWLYSNPSSTQRTELMVGILRLSRNVRQLDTILKKFGDAPVDDMNSARVKEFQAVARFGTLLRDTQLPTRATENTSVREVRSRIEQLIESLDERKDSIHSDSKLCRTAVAKHYCRVLEDGKKQLQELFDTPMQRSSLVPQFNAILAEIRLELKMGFSLKARRGKDGEILSPFKEPEIRLIDRAFESIPRLVIHPYFKGVEKTCRFKDAETLGYFDAGWLHVSKATFTDRDYAREYSLKKPGRPVLEHEIGHMLQLGIRDHFDFRYDINRGFLGRIVGGSDPLFPFREFLQLSGWFVVNPRTARLVDHDSAVRYKGERYNINQEFSLNGTRFVFSHDKEEKILYCRRVKGETCGRSYGSSTPYEQAADSLAFYRSNPEGMIRDTPKIFALFERHFRLYHDDSTLLQKLNTRLAELYPRERHELFIDRNLSTPIRTSNYSSDGPTLPGVPNNKISTRPGMPVSEFLLSRFERFTVDEQQKAVSLMLEAERRLWSQRSRHHREDRFNSNPDCSIQFKRLINVPELAQAATKTVSFILEKYNPAILPLISAHLRGEEVGIVTSRGNLVGHQKLISALEEFLGFKLDKVYFLGDSALNMRLRKLGDLPVENRKLQIIREFLGAEYTNIDGEKVKLELPRKLVFYEADANTYQRLKLIKHTDPTNIFRPILVSKFPADASMREVLEVLANPRDRANSDKRGLVLSGLDGALINVNAYIYIRDRESNDLVAVFTPEEWSELRFDGKWQREIKSHRPKINLDSLWVDTEDFASATIVESQVKVPDMFKRRKFQEDAPRGRIIQMS